MDWIGPREIIVLIGFLTILAIVLDVIRRVKRNRYEKLQMSSKVLNRIEDSQSVWEQEPLKSLADDGELMAFEHQGFWQPMDTLREKHLLCELWNSGKAPWKVISNSESVVNMNRAIV